MHCVAREQHGALRAQRDAHHVAAGSKRTRPTTTAAFRWIFGSARSKSSRRSVSSTCSEKIEIETAAMSSSVVL